MGRTGSPRLCKKHPTMGRTRGHTQTWQCWGLQDWGSRLGHNPEVPPGRYMANPHAGHTEGYSVKSYCVWCSPKLKDKLWTTPGLQALGDHRGPMPQAWRTGSLWRSLAFWPAQPSLRCRELAFPPYPSPLWIPARICPQFPRQQHPWRWERRGEAMLPRCLCLLHANPCPPWRCHSRHGVTEPACRGGSHQPHRFEWYWGRGAVSSPPPVGT